MHVFGPVMSRRLGLSLGVDPILSKLCNWNCVYCQLGRTFPMTNKRTSFCNPEMLLEEIEEQVIKPRERTIDYITFVGSGETLLSSDMGQLINGVKSMTKIPVAVITNGSLLGEPGVAESLLMADAVLPSLDAGSDELYRKINRPQLEATFRKHIDGLRHFRMVFKGKLWVEVMLVKGLNDSEEAITSISDRLDEIGPDEVHLLTPTRPPAEKWVRPADVEALLLASSIIGRNYKILVPQEPVQDLASLAGSIPDSVKAIVRRHPLREDALLQLLERYEPEEAARIMEEIFFGRYVSVIERMGVRFLVDSPSRFPS